MFLFFAELQNSFNHANPTPVPAQKISRRAVRQGLRSRALQPLALLFHTCTAITPIQPRPYLPKNTDIP